MRNTQGHSWERYGYQSYHRGIEISGCEFIQLSFVKLSIVPSWNWNIHTITFTNVITQLSIVPSWNWNILQDPDEFNKGELSIVPSWNWNTITSYRIDSILHLSIVPSWNWNIIAAIIKVRLKITINRTIVELKYKNKPFAFLGNPPINRTIVELKSNNRVFAFTNCILSIVPSWNWNYA